jgi:fibronectin type 3 domain-containing protein
LPAISGTPQQGKTLTVSQGAWNPNPTSYAYQWQRSTDGDTTWTNIASATAASYTPISADIAADVRVLVTASNSFGSASATTASVGPVSSGAPLNTSPPAISGNPHAGQILSVNSSWNPAGTSYTYQWQRSTDGGATWANIAGATSASYTLAVADESGVVRASVTATNPYGQSSTTSTPVGPVLSDPPINTVAPTVTGTTQRTFTLTATQGTWNGQGNTYAYQWQRSADGSTWTNVAGATASSYTLAPADEGDLMRVLVTASNIDGFVNSASAPTLPVSPFPPANTIAPTISGTAVRASILTATQGSWTGPGNAYSYQWQRDFGEGFVDITGATTNAYALTYADEGATVRVVVTATNPDGTIVQASQPTTTVMSAIPVNQARPSITGTLLRGSALTGSLGVWSGVGNVYSFQWQRSADGNSWSDIAGATGTSYALTLADEGDAVRVFVTASNSDGAAGVASSPTATIPTAPPVNTTLPAISGTVQRSATVTGSQGSWNGLGNGYSFQWQRSADGGTTWTNIAGATAPTYALAVADEHAAVRFSVTATNPDGTVTVASQPTPVIQSAPPVNTIAPSITGNAQRASVLTAAQGSWTGIGNTYAYQWQRSADGTAWTNITGATDTTYTLAAADEGSVFACR